MNPVLEIMLALLAAMGLLTLCWLLFSRLCSGGNWSRPVYAVVPAEGDGESLEGEIRQLLWLRGGQGRFSIIIADRGLTPAGRAAATALLAQNPGLVICPADQLGEYISRS